MGWWLKKAEHILLLTLLLIGLWGVWSVWSVPGLPTSHDSISHLARLYAYQESTTDGVFPVLWAKRLFRGIGSPVLMLNYQLPYYFAILWNSLGLDLNDSYKAVLTFSYVVSGILMYRTLRLRYKPLTAFVGAVVYIVAPYRYLNIYVRGALGEVFASMFPPIILAGLWKQSTPLQTIGWAGLFLSHPVGSALFSGLLLGHELFRHRFRQLGTLLKNFFMPYGLAIMIAAFNLLPTLALTKHTYYRPEDSHTLQNFPTFKQLLYSKWGYGFSTNDEHDEMSFQIGVIQWSLLLMTIAMLVKARNKKQQSWEGEFLVLAYVVGLALMIRSIATPIYTYLRMSEIIDFPWRILMIFSFVAALMATRLLSTIRDERWKVLLVVFIVAGSLYTNRNHIRINLTWPWPSETFVGATGDAYGEYASLWRNTREGSKFASIAEVVRGKGNLQITEDSSNRTSVSVESDEPIIVRLNMMYFPGWVAQVNDRQVKIDDKRVVPVPAEGCFVTSYTTPDPNDSGLMACHLPAGKNVVTLTYHSLPIHRTANLVTLTGLSILLWITYRSYSPHLTSEKP